MQHTKTHTQIEHEQKENLKLIKIGGIYSHYKNPQNCYKVILFAIQEATDKACVIYQAQYGEKPFFVRDVDNWLEKPEVNGQKVDRFTLIHE